MYKKFISSALFLFLLFLLMGCQVTTTKSTDEEIDGGGDTAVTETDDSHDEAHSEEETHGDDHDHQTDHLVIYSGRSEELIQPLIDQFAELTGIQVEVVYGDTAEMAANLLEEGEDSPADLFYAADPSGLGTIEDLGMLVPLPEEILSKVPPQFSSDNGEWVGVSGRARVVVYNPDVLSETELPEDLWGFTEPKWKGRIGWAPTNGSFQAMVTVMRASWGEKETADWLEAIQANEPVTYEKNTPIVAAVAAGEVDVGFVNHYYLYRFINEEGEAFAARNYFLPGGGPGSLIMVSGVGILGTAQNVANAEKFISYLLSIPNQQYFASQTFEYPLVDSVNIHPLLQPLTEIDQNAIDIPASAMSDLLGTAVLLEEVQIMSNE